MHGILIHTINFMAKFMQMVNAVLRGVIVVWTHYSHTRKQKKIEKNLNTLNALFIKNKKGRKWVSHSTKQQNNGMEAQQRNRKK